MKITAESQVFMWRLVEAQSELTCFVSMLMPFALDDVADVVQETNQALIQHADDYDVGRPFKPWMLAFAKNHVRKFFGRCGRERLVFDDALMERSAQAAGADEPSAEEAQRLKRLAICLGRLSERQRKLVTLRYGADLPIKLIAEKIGISNPAIRASLFFIRKKLADCMATLCRWDEEANEGQPLSAFDETLTCVLEQEPLDAITAGLWLDRLRASDEALHAYALQMRMHVLLMHHARTVGGKKWERTFLRSVERSLPSWRFYLGWRVATAAALLLGFLAVWQTQSGRPASNDRGLIAVLDAFRFSTVQTHSDEGGALGLNVCPRSQGSLVFLESHAQHWTSPKEPHDTSQHPTANRPTDMKRRMTVMERWNAASEKKETGMKTAFGSLLAGTALMAASASQGSTYYVDAAVSDGSHSGNSWANAYTQLWQAVNAAAPGDTIWVAQGTYAPNGTDRTATFAPSGSSSAGVALYGGFTNGMTALDQRDWTLYPTRLTGEIQNDGLATNNVYHIFKGAGSLVLDGFIFSGGCANGASENGQGGAFYCNNNTATLVNMSVLNCTFTNNIATLGGAVCTINSASPLFSNCVFRGNAATDGGAVKNHTGCNPTFLSCRFEFNTSTNGGALRTDYNSKPSLIDCVFATNTALKGGAVYNFYNADLAFTACTFDGNAATNGGAIYNDAAGSSCDCAFSNCLFRANQASGAGGGGGAVYTLNSSPVYWACDFRQNIASNLGGAICTYRTTGTITNRFLNCRFVSNEGLKGGGAGYFNALKPVFTHCDFVANTSAEGSGGAVYLISGAAGEFATCRFSGNACLSTKEGAAIYGNSVCPVTLANSVVCGNRGQGAVSVWSAGGSVSTFANTLFAGNVSDGFGGALVFKWTKPYAVVRNCTFANNQAAGSGGVFYMDNLAPSQSLSVVSSILWGNTAATGSLLYANGTTTTATLSFASCDLEGGLEGSHIYTLKSANVILADGGGNLNAGPRFAPIKTGTWTAGGQSNMTDGQTTFMDQSAQWVPDALQGLLLQPDTNNAAFYWIVSNTATTVSIAGLVSATPGVVYAIRDFHLCSTGGRWTPGGWVRDSVSSVCIDSGDPQADYSLEPQPNGGRINIGFGGNTAQASKTAAGGTVVLLQ